MLFNKKYFAMLVVLVVLFGLLVFALSFIEVSGIVDMIHGFSPMDIASGACNDACVASG